MSGAGPAHSCAGSWLPGFLRLLQNAVSDGLLEPPAMSRLRPPSRVAHEYVHLRRGEGSHNLRGPVHRHAVPQCATRPGEARPPPGRLRPHCAGCRRRAGYVEAGRSRRPPAFSPAMGQERAGWKRAYRRQQVWKGTTLCLSRQPGSSRSHLARGVQGHGRSVDICATGGRLEGLRADPRPLECGCA
jgi:hypothetical protein